MPHFTIEYSANLEADLNELAHLVANAALETEMFPLGGIRVRAVKCEDFVVADAHPLNSFVAIMVRIGAGRDMAAKRKAAEHIFDCTADFFADALAGGHFMLSLDLVENDPDLSFKANGVHARLKREMS